MAAPTVTYTFSNGATISASEHNTNFSDLVTYITNRNSGSTAWDNVLLAAAPATALQAATKGYVDNVTNAANVPGRLTLTTAVPITTSDVTAATTLYFALYKGNQIALYNGSVWQMYTMTELSIAVPATTNTMYDVWVYQNSGTPTLEVLAWTNDTTRATALALQNGIYIKSGDATRRYVGSFRTTGSSGQTEDSEAKRYVWNYYNRVSKAIKNAAETTNSWTYTSATFQQANANTANQLDFIIGVSEDKVTADCYGMWSTATDSVVAGVGIGLDSTTVNSAQRTITQRHQVNNRQLSSSAHYKGYPGVGRHFLAWLENSIASGTTTWYGDTFSDFTVQAGIGGEIWG